MEAVFRRGSGMRLQLGEVHLAVSLLPFHGLKTQSGLVVSDNDNDHLFH